MERQYDVGRDRLEWSDVADWEGADVFDRQGDKIGEVDDVYVDDQTRSPEWLQVGVGIFSGKRLIPVQGMRRSTDGLVVPYSKDEIKDSPNISGETVTVDQERELYRHYGLRYSTQSGERELPAGVAAEDRSAGTGGYAPDLGRGTVRPASEVVPPDRDERENVGETLTPESSTAESSMPEAARSQPDLGIHTVRRPRELVRLKKRTVTEQVQTTVPVEREELVVERVPINEAGQRQGRAQGSAPDESGQEIVLEGEEVVVENQEEGRQDDGRDTRAA